MHRCILCSEAELIQMRGVAGRSLERGWRSQNTPMTNIAQTDPHISGAAESEVVRLPGPWTAGKSSGSMEAKKQRWPMMTLAQSVCRILLSVRSTDCFVAMSHACRHPTPALSDSHAPMILVVFTLVASWRPKCCSSRVSLMGNANRLAR